MTPETPPQYTIALLATGDEISQGDIVNSNSQEIARRLTEQGMQVRLHMVVPDHLNEIEETIRFLLNKHDALIITGGLGPTSDDITRYALSKAIERELHFDEHSWKTICERLQRFGYPTPPESNRQQALFPKDAIIIPNDFGTAAGCVIELNNKFIFMLPGPPQECLPMIHDVVLPRLEAAGFKEMVYREKWLLFSVSEGKIAEELDHIAHDYQCTTGYRLCYPYLEFKLFSRVETDFNLVREKLENIIKPYLIGHGKETASQLLQKKIASLKIPMHICDLATGGLLETLIKTPATFACLHFAAKPHDTLPTIKIEGLEEYWKQIKDSTQTLIKMSYQNTLIEKSIPFRDNRVKLYAVEVICQQILALPEMQ